LIGTGDKVPSIDGLTNREKDCLRLLLGARTVKQIAIDLELRPSTVEGYLKTARAKLGVGDSGEAARIFAAQDAQVSVPQNSGDGSPGLVPTGPTAPNRGVSATDVRHGSSVKGFAALIRLFLFPPIGRQPNDLSSSERYAVMAVLAILAIIVALGFLGLMFAADLFFQHLATQGSVGF
jgi:DNA-binding CsgD family transcriptional regulator